MAVGALAAYGSSDLMVKHALSKRPIWTVIFFSQLLGSIIILLLGLAIGEISHIPLESWTWILALGSLNIIGMFFFYGAILSKGVALTLPIIYSWTLPSTLLEIFFRHEYPSSLQILAICTILAGLFLVGVDFKSTRWVGKGTLFALASMLTWGLFYFLLGGPAEQYGEWWLSSGIKAVTAIFSIFFLFTQKSRLSFSGSSSIFLIIALIGTLDALGLVSVSGALQFTSVAVTAGIISTAPALIALFGVVIYKEKINLLQSLGICATVIGLVLLVI